MTTQSLTVLIHPDQLITSNQRTNRHAHTRKVRHLREVGYYTAKDQLRPVSCRQRVTVTFGFLTWGKRDPNNWAPTTKALIDGFTDAGIWPDDNADWVLGPDHRRGDISPDCQTQPVKEWRRVKLTIQLEDEADG